MRTVHRPVQAESGIAAIEFALLLPLLVFLVMAVSDFARGLQANMVLINLSREAANLASRSKLQLTDNSQAIIGAVAASAPPLDMKNKGMLYITKLMGYKDSSGTMTTVVLEQYRWDDSKNNTGFRVSGYAPVSKLWSCPSWNTSTGACSNIATGASAPKVALMSGSLFDGEIIFVVESFYKFNLLFGDKKLGSLTVPNFGTNLYSMTVF
ncbi:TadE/TadG family type IV pilus assembly protein [Rugamonas aquatica]|uniref:Pilus assembly protein n=1 Tax=Rugamonas aquatica TaxID=2743357 RepID=A0A6A7N4U8_9BURK|nr:TadE/TadG family type IV pilus assembly protein [Rugamonas aquatica]MQA39911.1 pilus assembly protein [Rugamonas aquatica]